MTTPDSPRSPLEHSALQAAAGPDWAVQLHETAGSTNALAVTAPARNLVVVAEHQTAGRGRLDRSWEAPSGAALTFSAVLDPQLEPRRWPLIPLMAGLAVARALRAYGVPDVALKWPNDVLVEEQKICGILVERVSSPRALAVVGIGINVDQSREELPVPTATSLALTGIRVGRTELLGEVLAQLRAGLAQLMMSPSSVVAAYRGLSATLDSDVRVELPGGGVLEGRVFDIDEDGQLVISPGSRQAPDTVEEARPGTPQGLVRVGAGDVVHVRPGG